MTIDLQALADLPDSVGAVLQGLDERLKKYEDQIVNIGLSLNRIEGLFGGTGAIVETLQERLMKLEAFESRFGQWDELTVKNMVNAFTALESKVTESSRSLSILHECSQLNGNRFETLRTAVENLNGWLGKLPEKLPTKNIFERLDALETNCPVRGTIEDLQAKVGKLPPEVETRLGQLERLLMGRTPAREDATESGGFIQRLESLERAGATLRNKVVRLEADHTADGERLRNLEGASGRVVELANRVNQLCTVRYPGNDPENGPAEFVPRIPDWIVPAVQAIYRGEVILANKLEDVIELHNVSVNSVEGLTCELLSTPGPWGAFSDATKMPEGFDAAWVQTPYDGWPEAVETEGTAAESMAAFLAAQKPGTSWVVRLFENGAYRAEPMPTIEAKLESGTVEVYRTEEQKLWGIIEEFGEGFDSDWREQELQRFIVQAKEDGAVLFAARVRSAASAYGLNLHHSSVTDLLNKLIPPKKTSKDDQPREGWDWTADELADAIEDHFDEDRFRGIEDVTIGSFVDVWAAGSVQPTKVHRLENLQKAIRHIWQDYKGNRPKPKPTATLEVLVEWLRKMAAWEQAAIDDDGEDDEEDEPLPKKPDSVKVENERIRLALDLYKYWTDQNTAYGAEDKVEDFLGDVDAAEDNDGAGTPISKLRERVRVYMKRRPKGKPKKLTLKALASELES